MADLVETEATLWAKSAIPERHRKREPNTVAVEAWTDARQQVGMKLGGGFLIGLIGKRGTGKTQIAADVGLAACKKLWPVRYASAMRFFLEIRATYTKQNESELEVIERFTQPRLLILDEIQVRAETDFEDRMLTHLIDERYGAMRDTILIANLLPEQFKESVGESIWDRLKECGGLMECDWGSWRRPK